MTAAEVTKLEYDGVDEWKARCRRTFAVGDVVQWHEDSAPRGQERAFYTVESFKTNRHGDVEYVLRPTKGGRGYRATAVLLAPVSEDVAKGVRAMLAAAPVVAPTLGMTFKYGADPAVLVVLAVGTGTVKATRLNGDGRYWPKMPISAMRPCAPDGTES